MAKFYFYCCTKIFTILLFVLFISISTIRRTFAQTPGGLDNTNLQMWFNVEGDCNLSGVTTKNGNQVDTLIDKSGKTGRDAIQTIPANRPLLLNNTLNGKAIIRFDNSNDVLQTAAIPSLNGRDVFSVYIVCKKNNNTTDIVFSSRYSNPTPEVWGMFTFPNTSDNTRNDFVFYAQNSSGDLNGKFVENFTPPSLPAYNILSAFWLSNNKIDLFKNGKLSSEALLPDPFLDNVPLTHIATRIGANGAGNNLDGDIAELIIFDTQMNNSQRVIIENYLQAKYGIPLEIQNGSDVLAGDKYTQPDNNTYTKAVSGIARVTSLDVSTEGKSSGLKISSGILATDFLKPINDVVSLLFAYESCNNDFENSDLPPSVATRWQRDWYLDKTADVANDGKLSLIFNHAEAGLVATNNTEFVLLYRNVSNGNYQSIAYAQTTANNNEIKFDVPATLINDGYYTLGIYQKCSTPGSGNALAFDATDSYVEINSNANNTIVDAGGYTLEFWFKAPDNTSVNQSMLFKQNGYDIIWQGKNSPISVREGGSLLAINTTKTSWDANRWYHLAIIKSNNNSNTVRLLVDGIASGSGVGSSHTSGTTFRIGANGTGATVSNVFAGQIDEARLWNTTLTDDKLREGICSKIRDSHTNYVNLLAYYDFNESGISNDNHIMLDKKNNNTAQLKNFPSDARIISGARIGDYSKVFSGQRSANFENPTIPIATNPKDDLTVQITSVGTPDYIHIYYVECEPNLKTLPSGTPSLLSIDSTYWGVHLIGNAIYDYVANYNFEGNDNVNYIGNLELIFRDDNASTAWLRSGSASLSIPARSVSLSSLSRTELILAGGFGALPVRLVRFEAHKINDKSVKLTWQTATETNNLRFDIERSGNGNDFERIGTIDGAGNSNQIKSYQFIDYQTLEGINYYRLKQVDTDGTFNYSSLRSVRMNNQATIIAFPNPFENQFNLQFDRLIAENLTIEIRDVLGNIVQKNTLIKGNQIFPVQTRNLPKGIYFVSFVYENQMQHLKIVKQ